MNQSVDGSARGSLVAPSATRNLGVLGYGTFLFIAYGIVCILILFKIKSVISMARPRTVLTAIAGVTILSAVWSQNPFRSFYNGMFYLIGTAFVYYLVLSLTAEEIMKLVIRLGGVVCLLSAVTVLLFPKHGVDVFVPRTAGAWMGIFQDPVTSAKCSVYLVSPVLIFGTWMRRWLLLTYIAAMLVFIVETKAVSSLFVTAVFVSFMIVLHAIYNIDEETLLWPNDFLSMLYIVACCGLAVEAQRIQETLSTQIEIEQDISFERSMEPTLA